MAFWWNGNRWIKFEKNLFVMKLIPLYDLFTYISYNFFDLITVFQTNIKLLRKA